MSVRALDCVILSGLRFAPAGAKRNPTSLFHVPDHDLSLVAAGGGAEAVGGEGDVEQLADLPVERLALPPRGRVPDAHRLVVTDGRQVAAVGGEGEALEVLRPALV